MSSASIVSKVWSYANVLRDDGVGYGDYLEQITYLLFLKMADEQTKPPYGKNIHFPRPGRRRNDQMWVVGPLRLSYVVFGGQTAVGKGGGPSEFV